jgi:uncharacterized protein (TIGR03437 family)
MRVTALAWTLLAMSACSLNDDVPAPIVSSVTPDQAAPGTVVIVSGTFFCQRPQNGSNDNPNCTATGTVTFGSAPATPSNWTDTAISVEVPQGNSGQVPVQVTANGVESNTVAFTLE